jgi:hypothetical protein
MEGETATNSKVLPRPPVERPPLPRSERLISRMGMQSPPDLLRSGNVGTAPGGNGEERHLWATPACRHVKTLRLPARPETHPAASGSLTPQVIPVPGVQLHERLTQEFATTCPLGQSRRRMSSCRPSRRLPRDSPIRPRPSTPGTGGMHTPVPEHHRAGEPRGSRPHATRNPPHR